MFLKKILWPVKAGLDFFIWLLDGFLAGLGIVPDDESETDFSDNDANY